MLSGTVPFRGKDQEEVFERIKIGIYDDIKHISSDCRDLLSKMICLDVKKRITANQIVKHPWIVKYKSGCCDEEKLHDHE